MKSKQQAPSGSRISAEEMLAINEAVDHRLKNLPAETYQLIEKMVDERVAQVEKFYRQLAFVVIAALTLVSVSFFKITTDNAAQKVTALLDKSEAAKKLEGISTFHKEALDKLSSLNIVANEITNRTSQLRQRIDELASIDNVLRYDSKGDLALRTPDGGFSFERRDGQGYRMRLLPGLDGSMQNEMIELHPEKSK